MGGEGFWSTVVYLSVLGLVWFFGVGLFLPGLPEKKILHWAGLEVQGSLGLGV